MPIRFIQITDLHLSDRTDTSTYQALRWAIGQTNDHNPDFVIVSGDMTTYGTAKSAKNTIDALKEIKAPTYFTPGNAEHRSPGNPPTFGHGQPKTAHQQDDVLFLFPDTSQGTINTADRNRLQDAIRTHPKTAIITHYPIDTLDESSRNWIVAFITEHQTELYVAGHKHIHRTRQIGPCHEFVTRGLDPDKASGNLPGISLFERSDDGIWTEAFIPWQFNVTLMPCDISDLPSPIGWSIQGDPILATQETRATDLNVHEVRPKDLTFSVAALKNEITGLRNNRPLYLSWHLPNFSWDTESNKVTGVTDMVNHLAVAQEIGVNHLTVHVPQVPAHIMSNQSIWAQFEETYDTIFRQAVASGIRLAIENIHNDTGVQPTDPTCKFATDIPSYLKWITALRTRFADIPNAQVGAHFDIGHARNNGEYGNIHPLADWYAQIGNHILGYHIHQIRTDSTTGKTANHKEMFSLFDLRISYAGFLHAWSTQQLNRAPLFVEIRNADERRRSAKRLHNLFLQHASIQTSQDLPLSLSP
ncbi:MAG: TIM barrel protein [Candidatus Latescibacteria bacterium]|nr:TIM barrel protein [Candidatus Latescibacterota bacterium]